MRMLWKCPLQLRVDRLSIANLRLVFVHASEVFVELEDVIIRTFPFGPSAAGDVTT